MSELRAEVLSERGICEETCGDEMALLRQFYPEYFEGNCPDFVTPSVLAALRTIAQNPRNTRVLTLLRLFFPEYFDCGSADFLGPDILVALGAIAQDARPPCLTEEQQNLAEAFYLAYLISLRARKATISVAGPVTSEREGDIAVSYADTTKIGTAVSQRPSGDPWDQWNLLWQRCARGAILTRFGDPVRWRFRSALEVDALLVARARALLEGLWVRDAEVIV